MFFDGRSSKEGRRQRTINNSELTFIIYSSKAFWHKSGGGVDGVDFEDASASPRRSSSFDSAKSAERNKDGRPLHLFFFQQPVRDNFPNWIRFKFDASFWLAAIETTDENCNPLPPLLPSLRRHRRLRRPPSANRCHLIGLIELKIRWRWDFATILIVLIKFKWPANWRGWGTWQICSTPVQRRVLWRKSCSFFSFSSSSSSSSSSSYSSPFCSEFGFNSQSLRLSIEFNRCFHRWLNLCGDWGYFRANLVEGAPWWPLLCWFSWFYAADLCWGGVGAIVCDSPMVPHLQSLSVRWLTHFNRIYYYDFLKNDVNYCLISNV